MKVLLRADVRGQGKAGQVVNVSDGYARNYLFPKGLAVEANTANMNIVRMKMQAEALRQETDRQQADELAERLKTAGIEITAKSGESGRLFGSITSKEIAEALMQQHHIEIDKKKIVLKEHIKEAGEYKVPVKLFADIQAELLVTVKV